MKPTRRDSADAKPALRRRPKSANAKSAVPRPAKNADSESASPSGAKNADAESAAPRRAKSAAFKSADAKSARPRRAKNADAEPTALRRAKNAGAKADVPRRAAADAKPAAPRGVPVKTGASPRRRVAAPLTFEGALWLKQAGSAIGGADRVALLEAIRDTGSMTHAAQRVGISYKTAWDRVQDMNNVSQQPLVVRNAGGVGGGGTALTPYALGLIAAFREMEREHAGLLGRLSNSLAAPRDVLKTLSTLGLRTSARNQLVGTVVGIERGAVNAAVQLRLPGGDDSIHATLTLASLKELAIRRGTQAVALIKAPSVMLSLDGGPLQLSVRNALAGRVTALQVGAVNTEVQARLAGGQTMVAMLSRDSALRLGLHDGLAVRLLFQESSVILGVV